MRVLYFVERFWPYIGGVEVISARVLAALAEQGMEITVVTDYNKGELPERESYLGLDVRRIHIDRVFRDADLDGVAASRAEFAAIKRDVKPEVMHLIFTGPGLFFPVMTASICPSPTVLSFHGSWPLVDLRSHGLLRRAIEQCDWLTACSEAALADLRTLDASIASRSHAILNGLPPPEREPSPLRLDPPVLFCSARVVPEKGLDVAIDALELLGAEFPGIRLRIVGDGPSRAELEAQVERHGLGERVEFLGWRSPNSIPSLVDEASIVLVPSILEGFGLVALEGMLGGRPVVASRTGGLPEVLGDDGGVLVETGSAEALADGIRGLLHDPSRAQAVADAGRNRAQARFSFARCVEDYADLYRRVTANGHAS